MEKAFVFPMERKWVVAAFLDITGFRSWLYRASTAPEDKQRFIDNFYGVLQRYVKRHSIPWSKYMGDGILTIREFLAHEREDKRSILKFILELKALYEQCESVLKLKGTPKALRIRIMDGYVFKLMVLDPHDQQRKRTIPEYIEYCINTVRGLLEVNPDVPCLATEGIAKVLKPAKGLKIQRLKNPSCYPRGINREDVDGLHILNFEK